MLKPGGWASAILAGGVAAPVLLMWDAPREVVLMKNAACSRILSLALGTASTLYPPRRYFLILQRVSAHHVVRVDAALGPVCALKVPDARAVSVQTR